MHAQSLSLSTHCAEAVTTTTDSTQTIAISRHLHRLQLQHHEPYNTSHTMVAGSRSSLRRPIVRSNEDTPPLLSQSRDAGNALRSKRVRTSTLTGQEQTLKRRRLSDNSNEIPQLRIPLRSRGAPILVSSAAVPTTVFSNANTSPNSSTPITPLQSPSGKPQYEQIKIIEARAKASIRGGSLAASQDERRKLRSEDGGSRAKTELAQYFPDFEEMLSLKPTDPGKDTGSHHTTEADLLQNP